MLLLKVSAYDYENLQFPHDPYYLILLLKVVM